MGSSSGTATQSSASGGRFTNNATSIAINLANGTDGVNTNGRIFTSGGIVGTTLSISGSKMFVSPHPADASKEIRYVALEGPTADMYFRGTARLVDGVYRIAVPEHFRLLAREGSYATTLTAVGSRGQLWVESEGPDEIVVRGATNSAFHFVVYAERDALSEHETVSPNVDFTPAALQNAGTLNALPAKLRELLVKNGTLNPDGTYNKATAARVGWALPE